MKQLKACVALLTVFALLMLCGCGGVHKENSSDSGVSAGSLFLAADSSDEESESFSAEPTESTDSSNPQSSVTASAAISSAKSNSASTSSKKASASSASGSATNSSSSLPTGDFSLRGLWVSCFELSFAGLDYAGFQKKVDTIMQTAAKQGYNAVFCHVRAFADAYYPSKYFPFSKYLTGTEGVNPGYDPLAYMIRAAKKQKLQFHAWINPYRVSTSTTDPAKLSDGNIAKKWLTDSSERAVVSGGGIYFNPASADAQQLVLNGIEEILQNYDVDGIHFDDYFYPTTSESFDKSTYAAYQKQTAKPLSLADWRRANVNGLVSAVYRLCKRYGAVFGISPAAHISTDHSDRNYNELYADVTLWMKSAGYVDYIIPQLYFGYAYPKEQYRYDKLLKTWCALPRHSGLKLYIGLGAYKLGVSGSTGSEEWCSSPGNLLARQAADAKRAKTDGFVVFSYSATSSATVLNQTEIKNLFDAIR